MARALDRYGSSAAFSKSAAESQWDKTFEVNVKGYVNLIRAATSRFREAGGGKVVNVASVAARAPMAGLGGS